MYKGTLAKCVLSHRAPSPTCNNSTQFTLPPQQRDDRFYLLGFNRLMPPTTPMLHTRVRHVPVVRPGPATAFIAALWLQTLTPVNAP